MSVQVAAPGGVGLGPDRPSPEELVRQTRQVVKGLEALRAEHRGLAGHLAEALAAQGPAAGCGSGLGGRPGVRGQACWGVVWAKGGLGAPGPGQGASSPEMGSLACSCRGVPSVWQGFLNQVGSFHRRLRASEEAVAQLEEEKSHLEFLGQLRQYDPPAESQQPESPPRRDSLASLFPSEEEERRGGCGLSHGGWEAEAGESASESLDPEVSGEDGAAQGQVSGGNRAGEAGKAGNQACHGDHSSRNQAAPARPSHSEWGPGREGGGLWAGRPSPDPLPTPQVAATLNNLAVLYGKRGRYREAEPLCQRALEIREKVLGADHPDVAKQLNNLALLCQNQGKFEEVERHYARALSIYEALGGPHDPNVAKTKNNLASAYLKQNKYQQAEELYKEILRREALPAPLGAPNTGTTSDAQQQADRRPGALPRPFVGAAPSLSSGSPSGEGAAGASGMKRAMSLSMLNTDGSRAPENQFPRQHLSEASRTLSTSTQDLGPR
ncbi:hypothetical protein K5549_015183 [Capra hircus]|nr:hypothetical protein K5549_015183 [Capra hircus]